MHAVFSIVDLSLCCLNAVDFSNYYSEINSFPEAKLAARRGTNGLTCSGWVACLPLWASMEPQSGVSCPEFFQRLWPVYMTACLPRESMPPRPVVPLKF